MEDPLKIKNSASALSRSMRIGIATITSTALLGGVLVAVPAHPLLSMTAVANAQEASAPFATATGQVIDLKLLEDSVDPADSAAFLNVLEAIRAEAQFPGDTADSADIDLTALEGIDIIVSGIKIPLTDILSIDSNAGVLGANASTPAGNKASGAAGVVNEDGSIDLGAHQDGSAVDTTLDLSNILGSADVISEDVISALSLRIGAASASASRTGDQVTSEYALSNVDLQVKSPLVAGVTELLIGEENGLGVSIDTAVTQVAGDDSLLNPLTGLLGGVFDVLNVLGVIDVEEPTLALDSNIQEALLPLVGGTLQGNAVSIDLSTGTVNVNLEALGGTSAVDPNTDLLTDAAVQQIEGEIQTLLNRLLTDVRAAVDEGLLETHVTLGLGAKVLGVDLAQVDIDGTLNQLLDGDATTVSVEAFGRDASLVTNAVLALLGTVGTTLETALNKVVDPLINNTLDEGVSGIIAPLVQGLTGVLGDPGILRITLNDQPNPQVGAVNTIPARPNSKTGAITTPADAFTVSAIRVNVLNGLVDLPISRVTVDADKDWAPVGGIAIDAIDDQTITIGDAIDNVIPVVTPEGSEVTVDGLPDGVTYEDGEISGTPTEVGEYEVTVTATNGNNSATETFTITVLDIDGGTGNNGSANGSTDFLQQCLSSPAAGIAALLIALGALGQVAGPALEPIARSINVEIERQTRHIIDTAGIRQPNQPEWLQSINRSLADAANNVNPNLASQGLYAAGALALISIPMLCGMGGSSSSSS